MNDLLLLCFEFLKIGLFSFGGGLATLPFLHRISETYPHWFTSEQLVNMIAISESTPGPLGVNMATYAGYQTAGIPGAILATLSMTFPALFVVALVSSALTAFKQSPAVQDAFSMLRPAVAGLIASAGYTVLTLSLFAGATVHWPSVALFIAMLLLNQWKKLQRVHAIAFIAIGAVVGVLLKL